MTGESQHARHEPPRKVHRLSAGDHEERARRLTEALAGEEEVVFAYLFGSFAEDRPFEDIDVAVFLADSRDETFDSLSTQLALAARLEEAAGLPVDVIVLNDASLRLRAAALRGHVLYSREENTRVALVEQAGRELMDTAFLARESLRSLLSV